MDNPASGLSLDHNGIPQDFLIYSTGIERDSPAEEGDDITGIKINSPAEEDDDTTGIKSDSPAEEDDDINYIINKYIRTEEMDVDDVRKRRVDLIKKFKEDLDCIELLQCDQVMSTQKIVKINGKPLSDVHLYPLNDRGVALIICNQFSDQHERKIAKDEMKDLQETFEKMDYEVYMLNELDTIRDKLENVSTLIDKMNPSNFVCCICSYGGCDETGKEYIVDADSQRIYLEETAKRIFSNCKALEERPKVFFIQACRSSPHADQQQEPVAPAAAPPCDPGDIPSWDFLFAYATSAGDPAFRPSTYGDPEKPYFISELCKALSQYYKRLDIVSILQKVNCVLHNNTWEHNGETVQQVSWSRSSLRGPVFLSTEALDSLFAHYYCLPCIHS